MAWRRLTNWMMQVKTHGVCMELLSVRQVAELAGLSVETSNQWAFARRAATAHQTFLAIGRKEPSGNRVKAYES